MKPKVVWLIDTSGSMAELYPFISDLIGNLKDLGLDQKIYIFTDTAVPVDLNKKEIKSEQIGGWTNLETAFESFLKQEPNLTNTTVIIFSDYRVSSGGIGEKPLKEIVRKAKKVVLMNPDIEWDTGDSLHSYYEEKIGKKIYHTITLEDMLNTLQKEAVI